MQTLGVVEDTLFIPMLGRIYASEHYPQILYDKKALELKKKLPSDLIKQNMQSQYTLLASASRSANMDRIIRTFLERRPDGVIVQLGCGLETTYHRCDNGKTHWYAMDLPHVIEYRRGLLPEPERELYISGDAFAKDWIKKVRNDVLDTPILVTAGGLFHYFEEHKVIALLRMIGQFGNMEVVFDTVNKRGMTMMKKKYMKQVGHADAQMFFYVDSAEELAEYISLLKEGGEVSERMFPSYLSTFISEYFNMSVEDDFLHEDRLAALYYAYAMKCKNKFVSAWFGFNLVINNVLVALTARKFKMDVAPLIVGDTEVCEALRTSGARDFGLGGEVEWLEQLVKISETEELVEREKKIDRLRWNWMEETTFFDYFTVERLFVFLLQLEMIERWISLDKEKGSQLFRSIIAALKDEVRIPAEFR